MKISESAHSLLKLICFSS